MSDQVLISDAGRVRLVALNRPGARNAVDRATADLLTAALQAFDSDPDVDVAVLTGAGGCFCAGADLKAVATGGGISVRPVGEGPGPLGPTRLALGKPVIAAVEGYAVAGGLELALWCDLRVAARDAVFGVFCRRFGVPLIDGGTVRLPRLIGQSHALDLILTGRGVSGDEAFRMGLANRIVAAGRGARRRGGAGARARGAAAGVPPLGSAVGLRGSGRSGSGGGRRRTSCAAGLPPWAAARRLPGRAGFASGAGRHGAQPQTP